MAKSIKWVNEKRKISELKEHPKNPRELTKKQYKDLKQSVLEFGYVETATINQDNVLLAGHQRLKVLKDILKEQGVKEDIEIDVRYPERPLTDKEAEEYLIRSNLNTGQWDDIKLASDWEQENLIEWGFDEDYFEDVEELEPDETKGDDDVPDEQQDIITKPGDLYELGEHRVLCGDSTVVTDVDKLMGGEKAVLAHNDPPYGMKKEKDGVKNDNLNYDDLLEFNKKWINLQFSFLTDNGSFYCWGIDEPLMDIYSHILKPLIKTQKATFRELLTWNKGDAGAGGVSFIGKDGMRSYPKADEKCLFVMCGVQGFNNNADNYFEGWDSIRLYLVQEKEKLGLTNKELTEHLNTAHTHYWTTSQWAFPTKEHYTKLQELGKANNIDAFKKEYEEIKKEYYSTRAYFNNTHDNMTNVWDFRRTNQKEREGTGGHATPKPLELCNRVIMSSSQTGDIVADWFLGSGSTLIACEKTNRKCYGIELDPKYCDVIVRRYVKFCKENNRSYSVKRNGEVCEEFNDA